MAAATRATPACVPPCDEAVGARAPLPPRTERTALALPPVAARPTSTLPVPAGGTVAARGGPGIDRTMQKHPARSAAPPATTGSDRRAGPPPTPAHPPPAAPAPARAAVPRARRAHA